MKLGTNIQQFGPLEWVVLLALVALIVLVVRAIASFVMREIARKQASAQDESRAPEEA
jgi:flagellar biosynthesis/type III secretory pathway M-ring protein FliF/YscJ